MVRIEQLASPRILSGQPGQIYIYPYVDGALLTSAPVTPTVAVVDAAGASVVASTAATWDATNKRLTLTLTAGQNDKPKLLTATWAFTAAAGDGGAAYSLISQHETSRDLLFTEAEARAYDSSALASSVTYPADPLLRTRDEIHDAFEDIIGTGIGGRYAREVLDGSGRRALALSGLPATVLRSVSERTAGTQTWTAYDATNLADVLVYEDQLVRETLGSFAKGQRNIAIEYEHGLSPIPLRLRDAGMRLLRNKLIAAAISDRALAQTTQLGTIAMATAGRREGTWFGIPPVDAVLQEFRARYRVPAVR